KKLIMLPSETMIWQPEFTDKTLSRKPGAVHFPAKFAPHISLSINGFVTETIVFFYICLNLFLRYLWLALAFSPVRFSVHGINRSDIHLYLRFFSLNA
ncbi:hypothetical protein, partial [Escherichia coli]